MVLLSFRAFSPPSPKIGRGVGGEGPITLLERLLGAGEERPDRAGGHVQGGRQFFVGQAQMA
jgi:hypothetical protein